MSDDATPSEPEHDDAESLLRPSAEEKRAQETVMLNRENIDELMAAARGSASSASGAVSGDEALQAEPAPAVGEGQGRSNSAIFILVGLAIVVLIAVLVLVAR